MSSKKKAKEPVRTVIPTKTKLPKHIPVVCNKPLNCKRKK